MSDSITVNGLEVRGPVPAHHTLLTWLRNHAFYEVKEGCGEGVCGACTVLLNGRTVASCTLLALKAEGGHVTTSRGLLGDDGTLHSLQDAFWAAGAAQCGFCTQGMLMAAYELLVTNPRPSTDEIREALHGNLCRCTGYQAIVDAVRAASLESGGSKG